MKPPKFTAVFAASFPGFGRDDKPFFHHKAAVAKDGSYIQLKELQETACDMAFHPSGGGPCVSCRYNPMGVAGIDARGDCWLLVQDMAERRYGGGVALRWVKFEVPVAS